MQKFFLSIILLMSTVNASTSLDIYTNKFFINKTFLNTNTIEIKLPLHVKKEDIRYELDSTCNIVDETFSKNLQLQTEKSKLYESLKEEKTKLQSKIKALKSKEGLLNSLKLKNEFDFKKIEKLSNYLYKNILELEQELTSLNQKIEDIDKKLENLKLEKKEYKLLHVKLTCKDKKIKVSYPIEDIEYKTFYEIYADTKSKTVKLLSKAYIKQSSVEDLKNIELNIFSHAYNKDVKPHTFYPKYLRNSKPVQYKESMMKSASMAVAPRSEMKNSKVIRKELNTIYSYSLSDITLEMNKKSIIDLDAEITDAKFGYIIDAYGSNKAYLQANFKTKKTYKRLHVQEFLNSMPIASEYIYEIKENIPHKLYFGENQFVHVKKELIKTKNENEFFTDKETSIQKWKYTITNNNKKDIDVEFIARTPVSKDGDITVNSIAEPMYDKQSAEGKTIWNFKLEKNGKKDIIFGYKIKR